MKKEPFPKAAFRDLLGRLPSYGRLAWRLAKDPLVSKARRAALIAAAGYLASPIDAVPGVIPVLGQLDDVAVVLAAIRVALDGIDPVRRRAHLAAVGLSDGDLATDLGTLGTTAGWTARTGVRVGARAARIGGRLALTGVKAAARVTSRAGRVAGHAAGRAAGRAATLRARNPSGDEPT